MANEESKPTLTDIPVYFLGRREMDGGKVGGAFIPVALAGNVADVSALTEAMSVFEFKERNLPPLVGMQYEARGELGEGGRINRMVCNYKPATEMHRWENRELVAACEARDKAARIAKRARKELADLKKDGALDRLIKPLRTRWEQTDSIGRLALEVAILSTLRS